MHKPQPATGFDLRARIQQAKERIIHPPAPQHSAATLPPPATRKPISPVIDAEPVDWDCTPRYCPTCGAQLTKCLFDTPDYRRGEYFCSPCHLLRVEARIFHNQTGKMNALFPPGQLALATLAGMRADVRRDVYASCRTRPDLQSAPEAAELLQRASTTGKKPSRDIERAGTPPPNTRYGVEDEDGETEEIPAFGAEMKLRRLAYGRTSKQDTGENERLSAKSEEWML